MQGRRMISGGFCILHKKLIAFCVILCCQNSALVACCVCKRETTASADGRGLRQKLRLMLRRLQFILQVFCKFAVAVLHLLRRLHGSAERKTHKIKSKICAKSAAKIADEMRVVNRKQNTIPNRNRKRTEQEQEQRREQRRIFNWRENYDYL